MSVKTIIKSALETVGLKGLWDSYSKKKFKDKYGKAISHESIEDRFTQIYSQDIWAANNESKSGSGSTLSATQSIRESLPGWLSKEQVTLLLDLGCGDYHWMKEIDLPCEYIGADIVKHVIEENKAKYATEGVNFMHLNAVTGPIPECDAILCREVIFHLSLEDGLQAIQNCKESSARYLITTTNPTITENIAIRSGQFREINLQLPPYSLPAPIHILPDNTILEGRELGIWKLT